MAKSNQPLKKVPAKAKERAFQVNMMQRSFDEMGKFDNASATSVNMAITAGVGLGLEVAFYLFLLVQQKLLYHSASRLLHILFDFLIWV